VRLSHGLYGNPRESGYANLISAEREYSFVLRQLADSRPTRFNRLQSQPRELLFRTSCAPRFTFRSSLCSSHRLIAALQHRGSPRGQRREDAVIVRNAATTYVVSTTHGGLAFCVHLASKISGGFPWCHIMTAGRRLHPRPRRGSSISCDVMPAIGSPGSARRTSGRISEPRLLPSF
jgi:hypothetical protein